MSDTIWKAVTLKDDTELFVNFDQVVAIADLPEGGAKLLTPAGEIEIKESLADIQAELPI